MFNHAPDGYECIFCAYVRGEENPYVAPRHVVERTESTITFVAPRWWVNNEGHVLVIPTAHIENIYDLPDELGTPIARAARRSAVALKLAYGCEGTSTRQHNEPAGYQEVWHYHLHVFPRFDGDDLYRSDFRAASKDEMATYAERLRAAYAALGP